MRSAGRPVIGHPGIAMARAPTQQHTAIAIGEVTSASSQHTIQHGLSLRGPSGSPVIATAGPPSTSQSPASTAPSAGAPSVAAPNSTGIHEASSTVNATGNRSSTAASGAASSTCACSPSRMTQAACQPTHPSASPPSPSSPSPPPPPARAPPPPPMSADYSATLVCDDTTSFQAAASAPSPVHSSHDPLRLSTTISHLPSHHSSPSKSPPWATPTATGHWARPAAPPGLGTSAHLYTMPQHMAHHATASSAAVHSIKSFHTAGHHSMATGSISTIAPSSVNLAATGPDKLLQPSEWPMAGGQGIARIVQAREEAPGCCWGLLRDRKYWSVTLFAWTGRPLPLRAWLLYMAAVAAAVLALVALVPGYNELAQLQGLQLPVMALGTALFLLMAFRTNSCYNRWWEGRKLWGNTMARCLDLARVAQAWVAPKDPELGIYMVRLLVAYTVVLRRWLRGEQQLLPELEGVLPKDVLSDLQQDSQPVQAMAVLLTDAASRAAGLVPSAALHSLERGLGQLLLEAGACARIVNTPMPFAYIVHLRSFMVLWLLALPFAFLPAMGLWTIALCAVVGYQLLGFEDIGVEIEQPFGTDYNDLPIDQLGAQLRNQLAAVAGKIRARALSEAFNCV